MPNLQVPIIIVAGVFQHNDSIGYQGHTSAVGGPGEVLKTWNIDAKKGECQESARSSSINDNRNNLGRNLSA